MLCSCNKIILVTGGGGYIGSHTIVELLNFNFLVIAIDNLSNCYSKPRHKKIPCLKHKNRPESLKRIEKIIGKKIIFYKVDIRDKNALYNVFKRHKIDSVIHLAALKVVGESVKLPTAYYENNVAGSNILFEVMQENGVNSLIYSSSATIYGNPQFLPITEQHPTGQGCTNTYGKTKFFVEEMAKDICAAYPAWKVISLRYFNTVGAHESGLIGEDPSGISNNLMSYISQVAVGKRELLQVFGSDYSTADGTGVRDYIHISDLAIGHVRALDKIFEPTFSGFKAYNLGTGRGYSVLEVVKAFSEASGRKINYEIVERREGDIASCFADASLAEKELKWSAKKDLFEMCRDTWNWQSKNPNGFK